MKLFYAAFFIFCAISPAYAQQYGYKIMSPIASTDEEIIDTATSDWILVRDLTVRSLCPVAYNIPTKKLYRLCDSGVTNAYSINRHGEVAGSSFDGNSTQAVIWAPDRKIQKLGSLDPLDTMSEALSINDSGVAVGYSTKVYLDPCEGRYTFPAAFVWKQKKGMEKVIEDVKGKTSVAMSINSHGAILTYIDSITFDERSCYETTSVYPQWNIKTRAKSSTRDAPFQLISYSLDDGDPSVLYVSDHLVSFDNHLNILAGNTLSGPKNKFRATGREFEGRYDYSYLGQALSPLGKVAGVSAGAYLEVAPDKPVNIVCLSPRNHKFTGSQLTPMSFASIPKIGGFNSDEELYTSADLFGDGKSSQIIKISPLPKSSKKVYTDFCPDLEAKSEQLPTKVSVTLDLKSPVEPSYTGVKAQLWAYATVGEKSCGSVLVKETVVNGKKAEVFLPRMDERFSYFWSLEPRFGGQAEFSDYVAPIDQCVGYPK